jgi:predicted NBD/HSP70 family sugar kinase
MEHTGANVLGLRRHNRALVLGHLLRSGPLFQAEIAERAGLTQQGVSKIVRELSVDGLVHTERQPAAGVGKPRALVRLRAEAKCALGAEFDRDRYLILRVGLDGAVEARVEGQLPVGFTPAEAVAAVVEAVRAMTRDVPAERLLGLGVGTVGPVDFRTGRVHNATNMPGWADVPLRDLLQQRLRMPISVDKNTNAAAFAHSWSGRMSQASAVVLVGTGIGAGLIIDGAVYRGPRSGAGEFGHTTLDFTGPPCPCGRCGCLEALHHRARTTHERARLLGLALTDLVRVLDIERIVLFGPCIERHPEDYRAGVVTALAASSTDRAAPVDVEISGLSEDAVALGAALEQLAHFVEAA